MIKLLLSWTLALVSISAFAQKRDVYGQVLGSENVPLEMANVLVLSAQDSAMVTYGFTNSEGQFRFQLEPGQYLIKYSYLGYKGLSQSLNVDAQSEPMRLKAVSLIEDQALLDQVEVVEEMPIVVSGDTISYKADAFTNGQERKLEDVLEKLPGFEIDEDGQVKVEGKTVEKVLVEGKEFFDGDTKVATKNLPADAIDKVQVLRNYEEISPLQGLSSEDRIALNIKLKEGKKNLWFGDAEVKGGDPERYYAHGNSFYYTPKASFNFIGDVNNIGQAAFTMRDYFRFSGGFRQLSSRSGFNFNFAQDDLGIPLGQNNRANEVIGRFGAANFSYNPRKDLSLSGFVIASDNVVSSAYATTRTYIGLDSLNDAQEQLNTENHQHSTAILSKFSATYEPSDQTYLNYDVFVKYSDQLNTSRLFSSFSDFNFSNDLATQEQQKPWSMQQSLEFFQNLGSDVFAVELQHLRKQQDPLFAMQSAQIPFLNVFAFQDSSLYKLLQTRLVNSESIEGRASYYWVLNKFNHIEFNLGSVYNTQDYSNRLAEGNIDDGGQEFNDARLQNEVLFSLLDGFAGVHYKTKFGKFTFRPGLNAHYYQVRDQQAGMDERRDYQVLLPDALLRYEFSSSRGIDLRYNMSAQFNDVNQIMDGLIVRSYNSLLTGNDSLNFARIHNLSFIYRDFNLFNFTTIFAGLNYSKSLDPINNQVQYFGLQQVFSPINANGFNENLTGFASYSRKFEWFKVDSRANLSYSTVNNLVNGRENTNNTFSQSYRAGIGTNFEKYPNIDLRYTYTQNDYSGARSASTFTNHVPSIELSWYFLKHYVFRADYRYNNYGNPGGQRTSFDFLNASLEYQSQDSPWIFSIEALNLLNTSFIREDALSANLISTTAYNVLPRYVMLGVRYDL